jgi:hypothetical protein
VRVCQLHYKAKPCPDCEAPTHGYAPGYHSVILFREGVYEHMQDPWERPIEVTSPQQLRDECEARGLTSKYLRDGIWRTKSNRWI